MDCALVSPIHVSTGTVLFNRLLPGEHFHLRVDAPDIAQSALPGQFVHLACDPALTLRRPFSIFSVDAEGGTVDLLYKVVGAGTRAMARFQEGQRASLMGPLGRSFTLVDPPGEALLIGGGIGLAPLVFLAERLRARGVWVTLFTGLECDPILPVVPLAGDLPGVGPCVDLGFSRLADLGVANRIASQRLAPGLFRGFVSELAGRWLAALEPARRETLWIYTCGPHPMLHAVAELVAAFGLHGEASLEERMACGFGGCAGCVAPVHKGEQVGNARVCVDGPVFAFTQVAWEAYR